MSFDWYVSREPKFRARRLTIDQKPLNAVKRAEYIQHLQKNPMDIINVVNKAGKDALHGAGRGWYPESDIEVRLAQGAPFSINLAGFKRIEISIEPQAYLTQSLEILGANSLQNPLTVIENTTGATVALFAGYYSHCPLDSWRHRELIIAAIRGAFGTYWANDQEERLAIACALFFERSIVSYRLTEIEGELFVRGISHENQVNKRPANLLSQLLDRLQSMIFPQCWEGVHALVQGAPDPIVDALLPDVMRLLFDGRVRLVRGEMVLKGRTTIPPSWKWGKRVERLAEILVPYLQSDAQGEGEMPNPFERPENLDPDGQGGGGSGAGEGIVDYPPGDTSTEGLPGEQDLDSLMPPESSDGGTEVSPGVGERRPKIPYSDAIDEYYSKEASLIEIKGDDKKDHKKPRPDNIVVGFLDHEEASLMDLVSGRIDWLRTRTCEKSEGNPIGLRLFTRSDPLEVPRGGEENVSEAIPNLMVVVDSSSSMGFNPQASGQGRGKYDLVLLATWGMLSYFEKASNAQNHKACAINFSSNTFCSGWQTTSGLQKVKRVLGTYQGGGTTLRTGIVRQALQAQRELTLTVIITDGAISNTPDSVRVFKEAHEAGHEIVLLHIGKETPFTKGIREVGGNVHLLNNAGDLVGLCIGLARKRYAPSRR